MVCRLDRVSDPDFIDPGVLIRPTARGWPVVGRARMHCPVGSERTWTGVYLVVVAGVRWPETMCPISGSAACPSDCSKGCNASRASSRMCW